jgi:hypothetical protein
MDMYEMSALKQAIKINDISRFSSPVSGPSAFPCAASNDTPIERQNCVIEYFRHSSIGLV